VIPNSSNSNRIRQNFDLFDFELTDDEMIQVNNLNRNGSSFRFNVRMEIYGQRPMSPTLLNF
jgi:diketogulonate reductase-like aldo/keto reductase